MGNGYEMRVFTGNANKKLANDIADELNLPMGDSIVGRFKDGEINVRIDESVRRLDVFVVQPTCYPVNENLMELFIMLDALKRASAKRITAVVPYYGYARQDRKIKARDPISAKLVADLITKAGAQRLLAMDLHAGQIQGYFDFPVDHLVGVPILADYYKKFKSEDCVVVSPDVGGVVRARSLADRLHCPIAIIDKSRPAPNESEVMNIIGQVKGKRVIITDDLIDTGGTIVNGAEALMERGAKEIYACCTHALFSGPAIERIKNSCIKEVIVTDTIPLREECKIDKIKTISVAPLFAKAIKRINNNNSVSELF